TLDLVGEARYDQAFMFLFSARPGTAAAAMEDAFVPAEVAQERFGRLVELQQRISLERNRANLGRRFEVLAEGPSKKDPGVATTRTRGGKVVHVAGEKPAGTFLEVEITGAAPHHMVGIPA
ncbi:MAG: TRAM domain-containing protein, partial [Acidimicrobiia bacterium]